MKMLHPVADGLEEFFASKSPIAHKKGVEAYLLQSNKSAATPTPMIATTKDRF